MKKKEDILSLIKSLSKSEKRYFKLFIGKNSIGESSHYLNLFNAIDKAGSVERNIIQKLYGDDYFMQKQFKSYKNRLYDQILNSLAAFHSEGSVDDQILELIRKAKILYDKTLYSNAGDLLEKAKNLTCKYEKNTFLPEIIRWQKEIISNNLYTNREINEKDITRLFEEEKLTVQKIDNENEYWKLRSLIYMTFQQNGIARGQEDIDKYNAVIDAPVLKNQIVLSYQAQRDIYSIYYIYSIAVNKVKDAYTYSKKSMALMEAHPNYIEDDPLKYIKSFHNLLLITYGLKKYEEFFNVLPKFKSTLGRFQGIMNENICSTILIGSYDLAFAVYLEIGQFKKATLLLEEIETVLNKQKNKNKLLEFHINQKSALLYFANGDYHKALKKCNLILDDKTINLEHSTYSYYKVFQLIIHFEKENTELIPYLVKSIYKYLLQRKKLFNTERILMQFFRTGLKTINSKQDQIKAFKALKEGLAKAFEDPIEARFLEYFDVISWLESKIENREFGEILRVKSGYVPEENE